MSVMVVRVETLSCFVIHPMFSSSFTSLQILTLKSLFFLMFSAAVAFAVHIHSVVPLLRAVTASLVSQGTGLDPNLVFNDSGPNWGTSQPAVSGWVR